MTGLRYVDPLARRGWPTRVMARLGTNRVANALSRRVGWKLDPILLRLTRGRLATTLVIPTTVLETRGARTGERRRNAVIYFHDGPARAVVAASHAGQPHNPSWYHNVLADPDVTIGGVPARAEVVEDPSEQARLWELADRVFPAFETYRRRAGESDRVIPLIAFDLDVPTAENVS